MSFRFLLLPAAVALTTGAMFASYAIVTHLQPTTGSTAARPGAESGPETSATRSPVELASAVPAAWAVPPAKPAAGAAQDSEFTAPPIAEVSATEPAPADEARIEVAQAPSRPAPQAAAPPPAPGRQPANIDRDNLLFLIRSTLMALHQANETGNYSVLRELGAPGFQSANNIARLSEVFATHRAQKLDLSAVSILEPQILSAPTVDANNNLLIEGAYPQIPPGVNFRLLFTPVEGRWRLQGIGVSLAQQSAAPAAQPTPAAAAPPAAQPAPAAAAPRPAPAAPRPSPPRPSPPAQ